MTRISLYPHELKAVVELTTELTRLWLHAHDDACLPVADVIGPQIFEKLVRSLYGVGQYPLASRVSSLDDFKISEFKEVGEV